MYERGRQAGWQGHDGQCGRRINLRRMRSTAVLLTLPALPALMAAQELTPADTICPPPIMREFRAVWVATVNNIDWPSRN